MERYNTVHLQKELILSSPGIYIQKIILQIERPFRYMFFQPKVMAYKTVHVHEKKI